MAHNSNFDTLLLFVTESGFNPDPSDLAASRMWVGLVGWGETPLFLCSGDNPCTLDPPTKLDSESSVSSHRMRIPDLLQPPLSGVLSCYCVLLSCYLKDAGEQFLRSTCWPHPLCGPWQVNDFSKYFLCIPFHV